MQLIHNKHFFDMIKHLKHTLNFKLNTCTLVSVNILHADTSHSGGEGDPGWPVPESIKSEKSTRARTAISQAQLHVLHTYYKTNPKPDALAKEQLMEMTGLSSRVIRVWFQNRRCKDKKKSMLGSLIQNESREQVHQCRMSTEVSFLIDLL